jgi:hypothetical protein
MSWLLRGRDLIFGTYTNLPTIFIAGSLLIGSMTGIIPILVLGLVTSFVGLVVFVYQTGAKGFIESLNIPSVTNTLKSKGPCEGSTEYIITTWSTITSFVISYLFLNALANYQKPPVPRATEQLVANRASYMISAMVSLVLVAVLLIAIRMNLGCEGKLTGPLSMAVGASLAFGMWNLVDLRMGDVFQIEINKTSASSTGKTTPVLCVASPPQ